jgi:hypothetical protein
MKFKRNRRRTNRKPAGRPITLHDRLRRTNRKPAGRPITLDNRLAKACHTLPSDFEPYGERPRDGSGDCSCECRFFLTLPQRLGLDWGVCIHPRGPRTGLLTFEHQGCPKFKAGTPPSDPVKSRVRSP